MLRDWLVLPEDDMPLPPRVIAKYSKWKAWKEEDTGIIWVAYSCRHTSEPLPEWCGDDVKYDPTRSFFCASELNGEVNTDPDATGPFDKIVTIPFTTSGAKVPYERLEELRDAVKAGNLPRKVEGGPYPVLIAGHNYAA